jgi:pseudaminic acid cytidylyltransferase
MNQESIIVAVIPARGGSKRVPGKNVKLFDGKPIIHWPIEAAIKSGLFDHVVVSTDDKEIARVARLAGAKTPFMRPEALADDHTPLRPVLRHAILECERTFGKTVSTMCSILATASLLRAEDLIKGHEELISHSKNFVFAATHYAAPVQRGLRKLEGGGVEMLQPEHRYTRSQDLEELFYDAGQFYFGKRDAFMDDKPMYGKESACVLIPQNRSRDIDTLDDWEDAEILHQILTEKANRQSKASNTEQKG